MSSTDRDHPNRAGTPRDIDPDVGCMPTQHDIDLGIPEPQAMQMHFLQEARQQRPNEPDLAPVGIEFQPDSGLKQPEWGGAGPGLRRAGDGIRYRSAALPAREAAEQLGQPAQVEMDGGIEQAAKDPPHCLLM